MENNLFPSCKADGESMRDLPPVHSSSVSRMDTAVGRCGCGGGWDPEQRSEGGDDGCHDHGLGHGGNGCHGGCVGYEGCGADSWGLSEYPLAIVYAPCQVFRALYDPATALAHGTLFTELDLPLGGTEGGAFSTDGCSCRAERRRV